LHGLPILKYTQVLKISAVNVKQIFFATRLEWKSFFGGEKHWQKRLGTEGGLSCPN